MFLLSRGLNLFEANLVNAVYFGTLVLFEIPTGTIADLFGRKISFVSSCFLMSLGALLYARAHSFWSCALAEGITAIGSTFASGAFQAWVVDRLKHFDYKGSFDVIFAKARQLAIFFGMIGGLAGAFTADYQITTPWLMCSATMFLCGLTALFWMQEEYFTKKKFQWRNTGQAMKDIVTTSFSHGKSNRAVKFVIATTVLQLFVVMAPNMQWQPLFSQFLSSKASLGFIKAGISVFLLIGAAMTSTVLRWSKNERGAIHLAQVIAGLAIVLTVLPQAFLPAIAAFLIHEIPRGWFDPINNAYLNNNIPSKERATIISLVAMMEHIGGLAGLILFGFLGEYFSIPTAWIVAGGILIVLTICLRNINGRPK